MLASDSLSFCLCQIRTITGASSGRSELWGNLCCALKALQQTVIVKALMNGSTGDPEPAPEGKQQDSINSSCYCSIRIINTSAVLHGKCHVVAKNAGGRWPRSVSGSSPSPGSPSQRECPLWNASKGDEVSPLPLLSFLKQGFFGRRDSHYSNWRATWKKSYSERTISKKHLPANLTCLCSSSVPGRGAYSGLLIFRVKSYILQLPHQDQRVRKRDLLPWAGLPEPFSPGCMPVQGKILSGQDDT